MRNATCNLPLRGVFTCRQLGAEAPSPPSFALRQPGAEAPSPPSFALRQPGAEAPSHLPVAFTLVELLVVITIIGIMMAIMLPAVMAARESARRMACLNNLRRIGMALTGYQSAYETLPPGTIDAHGPVHNVPQGYKIGWLAHLLPYGDEKLLYDKIDFSVGAYDGKNAPVRALNVPPFVCPSCGVCRITPSASVADGKRSMSNEVAAAAGSWVVGNYAGCQNGVETPIDADNNGILFLNSAIGPDDVPDGLAHTIFVGEKLVGQGDLGWMSGTRSTLRNTGTAPNETTGDSDSPVYDPPPTPPNWDDLFVGGFGSCHPGVCNYLFGNGRTDSITNSIDLDVLRKLGDRRDGEVLESGPTRDAWW